MAKCCAPNCNNNFKKDSTRFTFYEFPDDPVLRSKWISNIGRTNWMPGRRSMLCSAHFDSSLFIGIDQSLQLQQGAIPTRFCTPKRKRSLYPLSNSSPEVTGCETEMKESDVYFKKCSMECEDLNLHQKVSVENEFTNKGNTFCELTSEASAAVDKTELGFNMKMETEKFIDGLVLINDDYVLEGGQLIEDTQNQSSQIITGNVTVVEPSPSSSTEGVFVLQNPEFSLLAKNTPASGGDDSYAYGNVIIVNSTTSATADDGTETLYIQGTPQLPSDSVIYIQQSSEEFDTIHKQSLNLSEIATPCGAAISDSAGSTFTLMDDASIHVNGNKNFTVPQPDFDKKRKSSERVPFIEDSVIESLSSRHSAVIKQSSPLSSATAGVVDLPVSFVNHIFSEKGNKCDYSDLKWQKGTFVCRLCGVASSSTLNLFSTEANEMKLLERMNSILPVMIMQCDNLPHSLCSECLSRLNICSELIVDSFNTHQQLTSVIGQDVEQLLKMPVFLHESKRKFNKGLKRNILLMEIYQECDKPLEDCICEAFEDLQLRVKPKSSKDEPQCSLVLFPLTDNCHVSYVEQVRTAAEALLSKTMEQGVEEGQVSCTTEATLELDQSGAMDAQDFNEDTYQSACGDFETVEDSTLLELEESFDPDPTEVQSMPVTDDISPYEFYSTNIRCPKFERAWHGRGIIVKNIQKMFYWNEIDGNVFNLVCRLCKKVLDGNCSIKEHLKEHSNISCHTCGTILSSDKNFEIHKCVQKSLQKNLQTPHRHNQKFWNSINKRRFQHWYQCSFCSVRLKSKSALEQHFQQHYADNAKCKGCGFDAPNVREAVLHHQKCSELRKEKEWQCRKCLDIFSKEDEFQKHQAASGHDNKTASWLCDVCGKNFYRSSKLAQHKKTHLPPEFQFIHQCPQCPKRYMSTSRLKEHMEKHEEKKYMCKVCGKLFGTKQILRQHEFTHGEPQFLCSICSRTFFRKSHLLKHMNVHSPGNSRANRSGPLPNRDGLNRCRACKAVFDQNDLLDHYKKSHPHIQLENYVCEICKVENTSYAELFQHQREVHKTGVKDCPFCERSIDSSTQMMYHLMKHEGMFPYNCPLCSNGYTANSILQDHIRRKHTGEKPFECKQCSKRFPTNGALTQHNTVHSLPHQLLPCPVCNQGFKRKAHLDVHIRTHTGEKPYPCPICDRPFRQRPDCVKHVRVIHGEDPTKFNIKFNPNLCTTFSQVVSVSDMELVLEGEDLMQELTEVNHILVTQEEDCGP